jgi:hypothetical protein
MNRVTSAVIPLVLAGIGLLGVIPGEIQAQFVTQPSFNSRSQYIPGLGVVRQTQFVDPTTGAVRTTTHSYLGSQTFTTQGFGNNQPNVGFRTVSVLRWVMTPFGPQLIRQTVTVPVTQ